MIVEPQSPIPNPQSLINLRDAMEISGAVVIRRSPIVSGAGIRRGLADPSLFSGRTVAGSGRRLRVPARRPSGSSGGFFDEGHLKYYVSPARCGERKKEEKKRAKLVKGLRKDLAALHSMGFGVGIEEAVAGAGEVKSKMISVSFCSLYLCFMFFFFWLF